MLRFALGLCLALLATGVQAASHDVDSTVADARLAYIAGDYATALGVLLPAAEAGDPVAQNILGAAYVDGNGVPQDLDVALSWYQRAAEQGNVKSLHNLGLLFESDDPAMTADLTRAAEYYDRAITAGYAASMNNRARMLQEGRGGPVDLPAAIAMFDRAVELGDVNAMNNLGQIYVDADTDTDHARALELFRASAAAGDSAGLSNLGAMYENGYAVQVDPVAAIALYQMAAFAGSAKAAVNLAYMLIEGPDGLRQPAQGYGWCLSGLNRAPTADVTDYQEDCDYLASLLDDEMRGQGEAMAPNLP